MSIKQKSTRVGAFLLALLFLATSVGFSAAVIWQITKGEDETQQTQEEVPVTRTLDNFTPSGKVETLQIQDLVVGTGAEAKADSTVTAHYTGALVSDGTIFESSKDGGQPATFPLNQVIQGWQQGVPGMKIGGTRRLIIPAALAYGEQSPSPSIPANSDLVFDIELVAVQ